MNQRETIDRIVRQQAAVRAFAAEQRAANAKDDRTLWMFPIGGVVAGAAIFAAGTMAAKLLG